MMHKFEKLLEKKGKKLSDVEKRAKKDVLSGFQSEGSDSMAERLVGLKKGSSAPSSTESNRGPNKGKQPRSTESNQGPNRAEELFGATMEGQDHESSDYEPDDVAKSMDEYTSEEIEEKIQMLMDLKNSRK